MRPIPPKLREEIAADPFMSRCAITGSTTEKIDWHHNLIFAGRQVNEAFAILPLSRSVHDRANDPDIKEKLDWIMLNRATNEQLARYSRVVNYKARRDKLNEKYGAYNA